MPRKKKSQAIYPHVIGYRADQEMLNNIKADIEANRAFGIRTFTDVVHAALTDRYSKENFWDSITRRLDRQKSQMQETNLRLLRLEEMFITFLQYYFTQFPEFDDSEKAQAKLRSNIAFDKYTRVLKRKLESENYTLGEITKKNLKEKAGGSHEE